MTWEVRTQMNKPNKERPFGELEWSSVLVDTQEEAELWWKTRTKGNNRGVVHTMINNQDEVVRVKFG